MLFAILYYIDLFLVLFVFNIVICSVLRSCMG